MRYLARHAEYPRLVFRRSAIEFVAGQAETALENWRTLQRAVGLPQKHLMGRSVISTRPRVQVVDSYPFPYFVRNSPRINETIMCSPQVS